MKKGLFLTNVNVYEKNSPAHGIHKKILSQVEALNIENYMSCKLYVLPTFKSKYHIFRFFLLFLNDIYYKKVYSDFFSYDYIYIRSIRPVTYNFIHMLKMLKKNNNNSKLIIEMPTYPYTAEYKTPHEKFYLFVDKIFRHKLRKYIDKIVTYSIHEAILGIPTIKVTNGIVCAGIPVRKCKSKISGNEINLVAIAIYHEWHGYDRLIMGLKKYYERDETLKVKLHFIGDGPKLNLYKKLVEEYKLLEYVTFYGLLQGEELTNIYNIIDIGICSLGCHRKSIFLSSELKSREYLARGIPIVSSAKIDVLPDGFKYCFNVPEDDSPIDIQAIIQYYKDLLREKTMSEIVDEIRYFAENNCDMPIVMKPIINYLSDAC